MRKTVLAATLCMMSALTLPACSDRPWLDEPTEITQSPLRITKEHTIAYIDIDNPNVPQLDTIARDYRKNGVGPLHIVIAADGAKGSKDSSQAKRLGQKTKDILATKGVPDARLAIVDIPNPAARAVIGYNRQSLTDSEECEGQYAPGFREKTRVTMDGYLMGCELKRLERRQIAHPEYKVTDLGPNNDGLRAANVVDNNYRTGEVRDFIPGYLISELGAE